jgi:hypothetical protein
VGATGIMSKVILPDGPAERRRKSRLCALRAMDRLGLLGLSAILIAIESGTDESAMNP